MSKRQRARGCLFRDLLIPDVRRVICDSLDMPDRIALRRTASWLNAEDGEPLGRYLPASLLALLQDDQSPESRRSLRKHLTSLVTCGLGQWPLLAVAQPYASVRGTLCHLAWSRVGTSSNEVMLTPVTNGWRVARLYHLDPCGLDGDFLVNYELRVDEVHPTGVERVMTGRGRHGDWSFSSMPYPPELLPHATIRFPATQTSLPENIAKLTAWLTRDLATLDMTLAKPIKPLKNPRPRSWPFYDASIDDRHDE